MNDTDRELNSAVPVLIASEERRKRREEVEEKQEEIRKRIRETEASPLAVILPADPQPTVDDGEHKRVAAHTRVSTSSTEQISSIENQNKWYEEKISKTPNWELSEIYSDEGKSGTSLKRRNEFRRMIQDALDGKFDLIICSSVSRFARNVSDCIEQTDLLKTKNPTHPVGVYFETENIYTLNGNSQQAFQMHSMLADWESANKSSRMILSYDQRITLGQYPISELLGFIVQNGKLVIEPEGALTVKYVFLARFLGYSYAEIATVLTEKGRPSLTGKTEWTPQQVANLTKNERRWGDLVARKSIVINYKLGKTTKNTYYKDGVEHHHRCGAFVRDHHEGIVSPELANAVHMVVSNSQGGGVSDLSVIEHGTLKGFVNVAPGWNAVNDSAFIDACTSVYSEDEYSELKTEEKIITGKEHSKIITKDLHDFEVPHGAFFINASTTNITISNNRIDLSRKLIERFGRNAYLEILYHPILQMLAFRSCSGSSPNAFPLTDDSDKIIQRIHAPGICRAIYEHMDWIKTFRFRIRGIYRERNGFEIMMFYLDEAQILPDKPTREHYKALHGSGKSHYIPYRNHELEEGSTNPNHKIWIPAAIRRNRDRVVDTITGNDIQAKGAPVMNTMVGNIPTREEALAELEDLLASM